jgi:hypothetical protein
MNVLEKHGKTMININVIQNSNIKLKKSKNMIE